MSEIDPSDVLTASRLDVLGKLPFAKIIAAKSESAWARELYFACLSALNPNHLFSEDGLKFDLSDYEYHFRNLVASLVKEGFNSDRSHLLVAEDGSLWNGAHRLAGCLAIQQKLSVKSVQEPPQVYGWEFFRNSGMHRVYLDELSWQFVQNVRSVRAMVLSSLQPPEEEMVRNRLQQLNTIVFEKTLHLSEVGSRRNLELMYGHLPWFSQELLEKLLLERFGGSGERKVTVFLYDQPAELDERALKEEMRALLADSSFERKIHGSDDWEETLKIAEVWTNANSLRFMNSAPLGCDQRILDKLRLDLEYKNSLNSDFVIDAGASLDLQGLWETHDIDHVCLSDHPSKSLNLGDCHNAEYSDLGISSMELILDPRKHLRWGGYKFSSLESEFLRLRLLSNPKARAQLRTVLPALEKQEGEIYFDADRSARAAKWQRKSRLQIRLDLFLGNLPPEIRRTIARLAATFRR